ncbi:hypothetical protein SERLA73DRAFT_183584 [Serpula lacrymans var. lacrymans S7.3]|uniref:Oxidase ustYa n=2 Tax=Serpula lacrymans var. lacrymans TaxID=341189 RepID=F8Q062_SERL3|nr:uncharacterized protein SERLADRAFT_470838 [Serpula lacrymans var. lacrymans S7.9]EGN98534.1 hypothetical protein SERLA73DRAFT_183584 [Serpula lacrymans var. lacrymans S7.3]EGO24104.1 hypothetical protein SERLADRAFT_470838 [Serpula lacrymans var. lacrymans S7.9]
MLKTIRRYFYDDQRAFMVVALIASVLFNVLAVRRLSSKHTVDDSQYSYVGDDHPTELPIRLDSVAMTFENTDRYGTAGTMSWYDWHSLDHFPKGHGFVRLGPDGRIFGVSMFHQIHCLDMIRESFIKGVNSHSGHCLNFLRQAILCNSDITLDPINIEIDGKIVGTDGTGVTHVCRDWTQIYDFVRENHNGPSWAEHNLTAKA